MLKLIFSLGLTGVAVLAAPAPTYYKDALPVLQKNCQGCQPPRKKLPRCHFFTFEQTRPWQRGSARLS